MSSTSIEFIVTLAVMEADLYLREIFARVAERFGNSPGLSEIQRFRSEAGFSLKGFTEISEYRKREDVQQKRVEFRTWVSLEVVIEDCYLFLVFPIVFSNKDRPQPSY